MRACKCLELPGLHGHSVNAAHVKLTTLSKPPVLLLTTPRRTSCVGRHMCTVGALQCLRVGLCVLQNNCPGCRLPTIVDAPESLLPVHVHVGASRGRQPPTFLAVHTVPWPRERRDVVEAMLRGHTGGSGPT